MSEKETQADVQEPKAAQAQAKPAAQEASPELTVQDLQALKQIIDVATQRGAFKANELMTVGATYNKLDAFLVAVSTQQQAQAKGE